MTNNSGTQKRSRGMDIALALALVLLAVVVGRELVRQKTARHQRSDMPLDVSVAPDVAPPSVAVEADGTPRRIGPRVGAGVEQRSAAGGPAAVPAVRRIPNSRLKDAQNAQRVLRAQTRALREETAADTLDPSRRRALSLTQEEILQMEKDGRLIF